MNERTRTPEDVWTAGLEALVNALGPADTIRFLQLADGGSGDYTAERHAWLGDVSIAAAVQDIHQRRAASR